MMPRYKTRFSETGDVCPVCEGEMNSATHVKQVQSAAVGAPVGYVDDEVVAEWHECLDCGHLDTDLEELPEGAREEWLDAWK